MKNRTCHAVTDTGPQPSRGGRQLGFTLVELMITIAIIGILAAIAVPSYREHVRRGAVEEALAELAGARVALEQRFLDNRSYAGACPTGTTRFTFSCPGGLAAETYTLRATGNGNVEGFVYELTETGARTSAGPWGSGNCWIAKKGDTC